MPSDAEERAIEVMAKSMAIFFAANRQPDMSGDPFAKLPPNRRRDVYDAARAALAALRAHDAETLNRVVMDSEGNVVRDEG